MPSKKNNNKNKKISKKNSKANREKEIRLLDIDESKIKKILKKAGATLVQPKRLMKVSYYTHPKGKKDSLIRLRDEGTHKTLTIKTDLKSKFVIEREIKIDSLEEAEAILSFLGCELKESVEKFREQWKLGECKEIVFDSFPGIPTYMELDCYSMKSLEEVAGLLGYSVNDHTTLKAGQIFEKYYGVNMSQEDRKNGALRFETAKKIVGKRIKNNKTMYNKIISEQLKLL